MTQPPRVLGVSNAPQRVLGVSNAPQRVQKPASPPKAPPHGPVAKAKPPGGQNAPLQNQSQRGQSGKSSAPGAPLTLAATSVAAPEAGGKRWSALLNEQSRNDLLIIALCE